MVCSSKKQHGHCLGEAKLAPVCWPGACGLLTAEYACRHLWDQCEVRSCVKSTAQDRLSPFPLSDEIFAYLISENPFGSSFLRIPTQHVRSIDFGA